MMQNHTEGKLDFLKETRKKFENVYKSICIYMVKFWKEQKLPEMALFEYE